MYKDIMAYLAEPESGSGNYFQGIDFTQFGSDDPPGNGISIGRKTWNFLADNIISKPAEGIQVIGYLFYGTGLALVDMAKTGDVGDKHIKMDMTLWGFKDGTLGRTLKYKDGTTIMSEKEKLQKIAMPGIDAMTFGVGIKLNIFKNPLLNFGFKTSIKTGIKQSINKNINK